MWPASGSERWRLARPHESLWGILWGDGAVAKGFRRTQRDSLASSVQTERGGEGLRRTLWESGGSPFKTAAFNHSATTPEARKLFPPAPSRKTLRRS